MSDDGFHEIQLNGKQLVFLFMAATVVSVVIFLCGVMVGRGVRSERGEPAQASTDLSSASSVPAPRSVPASTPSVPAKTAPTSSPTPPQPPAEDESVRRAMTDEVPGDTKLPTPGKTASKTAKPDVPAKPPAATADKGAQKTTATAPTKVAAPVAPVAPAAPVAPVAPASGMTSGGFAVQITALRDRSEADAIVKRLIGKGYPAFVVNPLPGKPPVYRVQVGRFPERAEADRVASRLQKEEQFSPWVTR
jgi:cell division septation protein DedD